MTHRGKNNQYWTKRSFSTYSMKTSYKKRQIIHEVGVFSFKNTILLDMCAYEEIMGVWHALKMYLLISLTSVFAQPEISGKQKQRQHAAL